jgi:hypothetical protein
MIRQFAMLSEAKHQRSEASLGLKGPDEHA